MIAYLSIQRFYVRALGMEDFPDPVVVTHKHRVIDLNIAASRRLVDSEMSARDAKASLMGGIFRVWDPADYVEAQKTWLDKATEFSDVVEPDEQHSAWIDLSTHPDPIATFRNALESIPHSRGGLAQAKWLAKLACERCDTDLSAVFEPLEYLGAIPVGKIPPITADQAERLTFLGYPNCAKARDIPMPVLRRQFGEQSLVIWNAMRGQSRESVRALYPEKAVADRYYFSAPVEDLPVIENAILILADRISSRLQGDDLFGFRLHLHLEFEDAEPVFAARAFTKHLHDRRSIYFAARRLFYGLAPTNPITAIRIRIPELEKKTRHQQSFENLAVREKASRTEMALRCVRKSYGDGSIRLASDIEISRRLRVLKEWRDATGWY